MLKRMKVPIGISVCLFFVRKKSRTLAPRPHHGHHHHHHHLGLQNLVGELEKAGPCTSTVNGLPSSTSTRHALTIARMIHMLYKHRRSDEEAELCFGQNLKLNTEQHVHFDLRC